MDGLGGWLATYQWEILHTGCSNMDLKQAYLPKG